MIVKNGLQTSVGLSQHTPLCIHSIMSSFHRSTQTGSQGKKQQSISSFFKTSGTVSKLTPPSGPCFGSHTSPSPRSETATKADNPENHKRPRTTHDEQGHPEKKRSRRCTSSEEEPVTSNQAPETESTLQAIDHNITKKVKVTDRTARYFYEDSGQSGTVVDEELGEEDEEEQRRRARLHQKFVKKLGKPDSISDIKRRHHVVAEASAEGAPESGASSEEEEASRSINARKGSKAKASGHKLTPMEKQVIDIKAKHADTILVVEVGYKYRFFGEDARIAAKELSIVCIPGKMRFDNHPSEAHLGRFASASIPVHRLHVHVKRLVSAGHKVGIVRQLETAALKAVGDNRNTPFVRKLTNLYTKGTYIDDVEGPDTPIEGTIPLNSNASYLLCITETKAKGWGTDEKVQVGIVAVQPATGDVIYDEFEDGFMRSEIETRLLHIAPSEFLIVGELSKATEKLVHHLSGNRINLFGDRVRVERIDKPKTMAAQAYNHISNFYAGKVGQAAACTNSETKTMLDKALKLLENVTICLSAMISHMTDYGLEHVFDLTRYFQSFSARSHMLLNGTTLSNLEIYQNQTDHSTKGSLFWTLDRTHTRFGQRLLRKWVGRPLLDKIKLEERISAVEELKDGSENAFVNVLRSLLSKVKVDLEKSLIRIYYGKCLRSELLNVLQTFQVIASSFPSAKYPSDVRFDSSVLNEAISRLPTILEDILLFLEKINAQAAKEDDKYAFFREEHETESILEHKLGIASVEHDLDEHRVTAAEQIKKARVTYVTVAGIEYLIEVDNSQLKHVPASWVKISGTKKLSRFHTPNVIRLVRERDQHKEALAAACDAAFKDLLKDISAKYSDLRDCVQSLATLDCLFSLVDIAMQPGYVRPEYTDETRIAVTKGRHPMVEQLLLDSYVPNDIDLKSDSTRALLVTGPNMGGKSSYVRQVALIAIMGQIGSYVPADSAKLGMLDAVFTRMGAFDNMMTGESTFMVELSETSDIIKQASPRSLIILDELGRGTSTHDGVAIAQAVLEHVVRQTRSLTLFITHYQSLSKIANTFESGELKNVHMKFREGGLKDQDITFLYEVEEGVAHRSYGYADFHAHESDCSNLIRLNVARLANVPSTVLDVAAIKSRELEDSTVRRKLATLYV